MVIPGEDREISFMRGTLAWAGSWMRTPLTRKLRLTGGRSLVRIVSGLGQLSSSIVYVPRVVPAGLGITAWTWPTTVTSVFQ